MEKTITINGNKGYYLPLFNLKGLKAAISPNFSGSLCLDHHHYALTPASDLTLYQSDYGRNVIFTVNQKKYFLNGNTAHQQHDEISYSYGMLYQIVTRKNEFFTMKTTSFIPVDDQVEVHQTKLINHSNKILTFDIITNTLLYGRSADNIRDHRHVTSLLNRVKLEKQGILLKPTLSFDERGHLKSDMIYSFFADIAGVKVNRMIPNVDMFLNGGTFQFPKGTQKNQIGSFADGYETMGAIGFELFELKPGEEKTLTFTIGIHDNERQATKEALKYFDKETVSLELDRVKTQFKTWVKPLQFKLQSVETHKLLNWVTLQPILRRYLGNSYLPHHDYGHGGRGWRDLWQDLLSLIIYHDESVHDVLLSNFAGVRIDGSNATIIGDKRGEFKADRNAIVRVWSDHGAWPLLTVKMYIDETGDMAFLDKKQSYFDDQFIHYTKKTKTMYDSKHQLRLKDHVYQGTVFEHLLLQNVVAHFNTGEKGFVRLEDADWNDGLDMAHDLGETVSFTHFYANNLRILADFLDYMTGEVSVFGSLYHLVFENIPLNAYFVRVAAFDEEMVVLDKKALAIQLRKLADDRIKFIHENAWIRDSHFQSYINNEGHFSDTPKTMSLTGQAMALLSQTANLQQAKQIALRTKDMLFEPKVGGYHLNSNYHNLLLNLGRAYGFAYGHKENGAVFSHMVMMYAYGLYQYDLVDAGNEAYCMILNQSIHEASNLLAGIPEYFNDKGIGMYPFLTGSASWLLKLLRTQVFGIYLTKGTLRFVPKLSKKDFINHQASIKTYLFGQLRTITFYNSKALDFGQYQISHIVVNGQRFNDNQFQSLSGDVEVYLDEIPSVYV